MTSLFARMPRSRSASLAAAPSLGTTALIAFLHAFDFYEIWTASLGLFPYISAYLASQGEN
jgi:hypothetical protein